MKNYVNNCTFAVLAPLLLQHSIVLGFPGWAPCLSRDLFSIFGLPRGPPVS